jgi:hypothetical protein
MSAMPYKTLLQALRASSFVVSAGITLAFGEESIGAQDQALPYVVMVPRGGPAQEPGYARDGSATDPQDLDVFTEDLWEFTETFQFYCWHAKLTGGFADPTAKPEDHAEATRAIRLAVLSALRDQLSMVNVNGQAYRGLAFKVLRSDWEQMQNAVNRFGRALVLTVQIDIPEVMDAPTSGEQVVETTEFDPSINYSIVSS